MHYKDETYHIKVDWETHQILMKCRDNLFIPMAGRIPQGIVLRGTADYKGEKTSKPDYRSFIASFDVANIERLTICQSLVVLSISVTLEIQA